MFVLWQYEISPFCDKVRRALRYKKQPFTTRDVTLIDALGPMRRKNPAGKVPFLDAGDETICDSTEIVHWLERRCPDPPLLPRDPHARAQAHLLEDWADESLYFVEMYLRFALPHNTRRWVPVLAANDAAPVRAVAPAVVPLTLKRTLSAQGTGRKSKEAVLRDLARHLEAIDALLDGRDFLVGASLTHADLAVFAQLHCIRGAEEGGQALERHPRIATWMDRVDRATA